METVRDVKALFNQEYWLPQWVCPMHNSCLSGFWSNKGQDQEQLTESACDLIQATWRSSTENHYSSAYQQGLK